MIFPQNYKTKKTVILSEASRSLIARGAVEGPAVVLVVVCFTTKSAPTPTSVISTGGGALAAAVERPPHSAFAFSLTQPKTVIRTAPELVKVAVEEPAVCSSRCLFFCLSSRRDLLLQLQPSGAPSFAPLRRVGSNNAHIALAMKGSKNLSKTAFCLCLFYVVILNEVKDPCISSLLSHTDRQDAKLDGVFRQLLNR